MQPSGVTNSRLRAELIPHFDRPIPGLGDVLGNVRLLIAKTLRPTMLVFFAHAIAIRIMMIGSEVERIDPARAAMDEGIGQSPRHGIVAGDLGLLFLRKCSQTSTTLRASSTLRLKSAISPTDSKGALVISDSAICCRFSLLSR